MKWTLLMKLHYTEQLNEVIIIFYNYYFLLKTNKISKKVKLKWQLFY